MTVHPITDKEKGTMERQDTVISIQSDDIDACRICQCDSSCGELISPCYCSGSLRFVHRVCLQRWIGTSRHLECEVCRYSFSIELRLKRPCEWESLPTTSSEKRRFVCSAIFNSIALGCVIWLLYSTTVSVWSNMARMEWPFWLVMIGYLVAAHLIYDFGKYYFLIIQDWIKFNRTFWIINSSPVPVMKCSPSTANLSNSGSALAINDSATADRSKALLLPPVLSSPPASGASDNFDE